MEEVSGFVKYEAFVSDTHIIIEEFFLVKHLAE